MATTNFLPGTIITSAWLNDVDGYVYQTTTHTATDGQVLFSTPDIVPNNQLLVMINGLVQQNLVAYTVPTSTSIQFTEGLSAGDVVTIRG